MNLHQRRAMLAADPATPATWMKTQLATAVRDLERKFPTANITVIVSAPGCAGEEGKPSFSHATSANGDDLRSVLRALSIEMVQ